MTVLYYFIIKDFKHNILFVRTEKYDAEPTESELQRDINWMLIHENKARGTNIRDFVVSIYDVTHLLQENPIRRIYKDGLSINY